MSDRLNNLISQWTRLGAGFSADQSPEPPDLERMLLETARQAPGMPRLFIMAATWLHRYGDLIATHRLKRLIREELEREHQTTLGLLLDIAQKGTHPAQFASIIRKLSPAAEPRPLFDIERSTAKLVERARRRASSVSLRWGRWCDLARRSGGSRAQVRCALDNLEMTGKARRTRSDRERRTRIYLGRSESRAITAP